MGGRLMSPLLRGCWQDFQESSRVKFRPTPVKLALSDEDVTKLNIHDKLLKHTLAGAIELSQEKTEMLVISTVVSTKSEPNAATQHRDEDDAAQADDHPQEDMQLLRSVEEPGALKPLASERFLNELPRHGKSTASGGGLANSSELFADLLDSNGAVDICIADPSTLTVREVTSNASFATASGDGVDRVNVQPVPNPVELTAAISSTTFPSPSTVMSNPDDIPSDTDIDAQGGVLEHSQAEQTLVSDDHPVPQDSSFLAGFRTLQAWAEVSYQQLESAFSSGMALWSTHTSELRVIGENVVGFVVLSLIGLVFSSVFTLAAAIPELALALFEGFDSKARAKIKLLLLLVLGFAVYYMHATPSFWLLAIAASTFYYWTGHPVSSAP
ncbi:hypothetical protein BBJ28_00014681 [Nothophytophthora sp. Chile5]|nr:hypothetical protein BBJ28_00014681 [Nothophytophthora sp. Chile5]